jgi:hypothetical protein
MTKVRVTRVTIDPITFRESTGLVYIPRIEDTALDDQLTSGCYSLPRKMAIYRSSNRTSTTDGSLVLSPSEKGTNERYRPPTPPKTRDKLVNSPRKSPKMSSPHRSPAGTLNVGTLQQAMNLIRISPLAKLQDDTSDSSLSEIGALMRSPLVVKALTRASALANEIRETGHGPKQKNEVRFADEVELNEISFMRKSLLEDLFYGSEELAEFRYQAFMEQAGLDVNDFD